jgi:hypothetical protein
MNPNVLLVVAVALVGLIGSTRAQDNPIDCDLCKTLFALADEVVEGRITEDAAFRIAYDVCEAGHGGGGYRCTGEWQCNDLCTGIIHEFEPVVFQVATQLLLNPESHCIKLGYCKPLEQQRAAAAHSPRLPISVKLPEPIAPKRAPAQDGIIRIVQVSSSYSRLKNAASSSWAA